MPGAYLWLWDKDAGEWKEALCDASGQLKTSEQNWPADYPLPAAQVTDLKKPNIQNFPATYPLSDTQITALRTIGWDSVNSVWRKLAVNDEGKLIIDPTEVTLDKLGDVNVPTPTNDEIIYWAGTSDEILRPNAVGDETNIHMQYPDTGQHWDKVDDATPDDFGTYIYTSHETYERDLYKIPSPSGSGIINKITVYFFACGADANVKASVKSNSTITDGDEKTLTAAWTTYSQEWATNPADGQPWEWADIETLQIGVSVKLAITSSPNITQVYVEINYTIDKWQSRVLAAGDIPNLDAAKITTGILDPARVGPKIQDADGDTSWDTEQSADEDKIHGKVKGVEAFVLDDAGVLTLPKQSAVMVYRADSAQSIPDAVVTKVELNAESYDIQNEFDPVTNYRFTAKTAGIYFTSGFLLYRDMADGDPVAILFEKNGTMYYRSDESLGAAMWPQVAGSATIDLAVGDYIEVFTQHRHGSARDIADGASQTAITIVKLA